MRGFAKLAVLLLTLALVGVAWRFFVDLADAVATIYRIEAMFFALENGLRWLFLFGAVSLDMAMVILIAVWLLAWFEHTPEARRVFMRLIGFGVVYNLFAVVAITLARYYYASRLPLPVRVELDWFFRQHDVQLALHLACSAFLGSAYFRRK